MPANRPAYHGLKVCASATGRGSAPTRWSVVPTYQASCSVTVRDSPGASENGTKRLAPGDGAPSVTAGRSTTAPACTSFHAIVSGSHQPPLNHAAFTLAPASVTAAEKAPASHGFF